MNEMKLREQEKIIPREYINPVIEAIKCDARIKPELYVRKYKVPTEGE